MKRIIRLNAVENICPVMLLGMNQHSLHPKESLSPQKLAISRVSVASPNLVFLNTLNTNSAITLSKSATTFENIHLLGSLSLRLVNRFCEILSSVVLSTSNPFLISFEMKSRGKIEQVRVYINQLQLSLIKAVNCIQAKFVLPQLLPFHAKRRFWGIISLSIVIKSWEAKNYFSYLLFLKRVTQNVSYYLCSVFHFDPTNLACSNIKDKIAFRKKVARLANNLQFILL